MIHLRQLIPMAAVAAALFFGTGCSTVSSRIKERPQAYQKLSPADKQLVEEGKVRNGSGKDAVYFAWGRADLVTTGDVKGKAFEKWTYFGFQQETIPHYTTIPRPVGNGRFTLEVIYDPIYISHRYVWREASFENEKVVAWSESPLR